MVLEGGSTTRMLLDPAAAVAAMCDVPEAVDPAVFAYWTACAKYDQVVPVEPSTHSRVYRVQLEHPAPDEGWYTLAGVRYGPFASPETAEAHLLGRIQAWQRRARSVGGHVIRRTHLEILVVLPRDIPFTDADSEEPAPWVRPGG